MQYINKDLDLGSSQDYSFSCSSGGNNNSSSSSSGGGSGGEAIQEGEFIALAWADIYLLNPVINKTNKAVFIGGRKELIIQYTAIAAAIVTTIVKIIFS